MHKCILKSFDMIKSFLKFLKIVDVFVIMMLLLYWIEHLIEAKWAWLNFIRPLLDCCVVAGKEINNYKTIILGMVLEYKYIIAILILLFVYLIIHFMYLLTCKTQEVYEDGHNKIKKIQEDNLNKTLAKQQMSEQKNIKEYSVYISLFATKSKFIKSSNINLEEQKEIMNNFMFEKTGVKHRVFDEGFIYDYDNFDKIDRVLKILFKILKTEAPLNYQICVLIKEKSDNIEKMRKLISLGFINRISTLSNTAYRYTFVENSRFKTSQLGLFQKGNDVFEAHEFVEKI